jgi:hypothetical protein
MPGAGRSSRRCDATGPITCHGPGKRTGSHLLNPALFLLALALFCCAPCAAVGYLYTDIGNQPSLAASPQGDTRYYPGDTFTVTVVLTNSGRDTAAQLAPRLMRGAYDPTTALGVVVRPSAGDSPVTIRSLPEMAGDIGSFDQVPVTIQGTIRQDATPGLHTLLLNVTYSYVYAIPDVGPDYSTIEPLYYTKNQILPVPFHVMATVRPGIVSATPENLVPGTQGYLNLIVNNTGYRTGTEVTLRLVPADNATFQMVDDSVYLPRFMPGDVVPLRARIAVQDGTAAGMYPATVQGQYRDTNGTFRAIDPVATGIRVSRGPVIETLARNLTLSPGGKRTLAVTYLNTGDTPAYDAEARIIGSQVLVAVQDSFDLGTMKPGDTRTATFVLSTDAATSGKQYVINSNVKYRDGLRNLVLSDPIWFGVEVTRPTGLDAVVSSPVSLIIAFAALALLGYAGWRLFRGRHKD